MGDDKGGEEISQCEERYDEGRGDRQDFRRLFTAENGLGPLVYGTCKKGEEEQEEQEKKDVDHNTKSLGLAHIFSDHLPFFQCMPEEPVA